MGGPSAESKANEAAQTAFYKDTTAQQKTTFGEQQDLYKKIVAITTPIIAKGPEQYGFTPEVDALLKQQIETGVDQATARTISATQLAERQRGGGAPLPMGADLQLEEQARVLGEQSKSKQLTEEKLAGYQRGSELYNQAVGQLSGVTGNPTSYTTAATGAGQNATSAINLADSERSTLLSSLLGGAIQGGLALATGGASKALNIPLAGGG